MNFSGQAMGTYVNKFNVAYSKSAKEAQIIFMQEQPTFDINNKLISVNPVEICRLIMTEATIHNLIKTMNDVCIDEEQDVHNI